MSSGTTSSISHGSNQLWYYGIPWTFMQIEGALACAEPTAELERRKRARENLKWDPQQPDNMDAFDWAYGSIGAIVDRHPDGLVTAICEDPSMMCRIDVLVLRMKCGNSEGDLEGSPDLAETRVPTEAQVEELKRRGWVVRWYKGAVFKALRDV